MSPVKHPTIIIDASALIHRAFHALPPLTTKDGKPVGAVYGVASTLLKILKEFHPRYLVAAFDREEPTFRHQAFASYKATRPKTPPDLEAQFTTIRELFAVFGISVIDRAGWEADDIIGSLAKTFARRKNLETLIVTGDLDTLQLVNARVKVYTFGRGMSDAKIYDEEAVKDRYGISPQHLPDFKGLVGDPSDNIPGVRGIGEKTASNLIQTYHSIDKLYKALPTAVLAPKAKHALETQHEEALFSKQLSTIDTSLALDVRLENLDWEKQYKGDAAATFLRSLGFYSLVNRLPEIKKSIEGQDTSSLPPRTYKNEAPPLFVERVTDDTVFKQCLSLAMRTHTVYISWEGVPRDVFVLVGDTVFAFLEGALSRARIDLLMKSGVREMVGHNFKELLRFTGYAQPTVSPQLIDLMVGAYLLHPGLRTYDLNRLIFDELGGGLALASPEGHLLSIRELDTILRKKMKDEGLDTIFYEIETPLIPILTAMEAIGIAIDAKRLVRLAQDFQEEAGRLEKKIYKLAGLSFNINSPQQLREVLFEKLKLPTKKVKKTSTGALSTASPMLTELEGEYEIVSLIARYREFMKLKTTYADTLPTLVDPTTNRIHTTFSQVATATGRLASSGPNLQNIPVRSSLGRTIRSCFVSENGWQFVSFDYSQIELRIAASLSHDPYLQDLFMKRDDVHRRVAQLLWHVPQDRVTGEMRNAAKALNFGFLYGISLSRFARDAGITLHDAKVFTARYRETFPRLMQYLEELKEEARSTGKATTFLGRFRKIPEIQSSNHELRSQGERMAVNMPIQGSQADIIKKAMIEVARDFTARHSSARLLLQIHDELLFEIKDDILEEETARIKHLMEGVVTLEVPLVVDIKIAPRWGDMV